MLTRITLRFWARVLAGSCAAALAIPAGASALDKPRRAPAELKRDHAGTVPARRQAVERAQHAAAPGKHKGKAKEGARGRRHRSVHGPDYRPPHAEILVDENSGKVLHEVSSDSPCHPASLTKIMTLYMLFEQLESGKLKLDTPLQVSAHAARQAPTKLGLKADQTIKVEDAIKAIVTKSANDAAVTVGEAIGGSEGDFARLMTEKATELGMTGTNFVNASGLPADAQLTTARDQAILARAIYDRFPNYYAYFATPKFQYHGIEMKNHNSLLGTVEGVDGIKTGYTDASGYNLVSSVRRGERYIVAVLLGGTSNGARDARMRQLIEEYIGRAATKRTGAGQDNVHVDSNRSAAPASAPGVAPGGSVATAAPSAKSEQASTSARTAVKPPSAAEPARTTVAPINSAGPAFPPVVPLQ
jgi:D-alanyl-D-alanine carboxypeptidase